MRLLYLSEGTEGGGSRCEPPKDNKSRWPQKRPERGAVPVSQGPAGAATDLTATATALGVAKGMLRREWGAVVLQDQVHGFITR